MVHEIRKQSIFMRRQFDWISVHRDAAGARVEPNRPAEFTGPGSLALNSGVFPPYGKFISFFLAEDGFTLPNQRAISGPSGSFAITVEKSFDLNTWSPVLLENTSDETKAFYRLRMQR